MSMLCFSLVGNRIIVSYNKLHFLVCNREDALYSLMENLQVFAEQAEVAKSLGADIIVFPEVPNLKHRYSNEGLVKFLRSSK